MNQIDPTSSVSPETWRALLSAAEDFEAIAPWEFIYDTNAIGLTDPATGEIKIAVVLGNAGDVFAAVFYRRAGLRWILSMLSDDFEAQEHDVEGLEFLKLEFVHRNELSKEDKAILKAASFKPARKGAVWPQFHSADPGWHPRHITQTEADQLLLDLPRLTAFCRMLENHSDLFDGRAAMEIAFIPALLPSRPLVPDDIDWRPMLVPPMEGLNPFHATEDQLKKLRALKPAPKMECEFECSMLPGASFVDNGRSCFGRVALLVEKQRGRVLGVQVVSGALPPGEAFGRSFVETLLAGGSIPGKVLIGGSRFQPVLQPLCDELKIDLLPVSSLPALEEAIASLGEFLLAGAGPL